MTISSTIDLAECKKLLSMDYHSAVAFLLTKYGPARDNYFSKISYERFLKGENKSITPGKYSRTTDGLYAHHILENKYQNISNQTMIREEQYPWKYQMADQLVYANLAEHLILHILIKQEKPELTGGLFVFLIPTYFDWYFARRIPKQKWRLNCFQAAELSPEDSQSFWKEIQLRCQEEFQKPKIIRFESVSELFHEVYGQIHWKDYVEHTIPFWLRRSATFTSLMADYLNNPRKPTKLEVQKKTTAELADFIFSDDDFRAKERQAELSRQQMRADNKKRQAEWNAKHSDFVAAGITADTPRTKLLKFLYTDADKDQYPNFASFKTAQLNCIRDDLLDQVKDQLQAKKKKTP